MNQYQRKLLLDKWMGMLGTQFPIDYARPVIDAGDGNFATEYSMSASADIGNGQKEYLLPTVVGAAIQSPQNAFKAFMAGKNAPIAEFDNPQEAENYAKARTRWLDSNRALYNWGIKPLSKDALIKALDSH